LSRTWRKSERKRAFGESLMKIALREARPVDYGFARQLYRTTMRDRIEAAFGWTCTGRI